MTYVFYSGVFMDELLEPIFLNEGNENRLE